MSWAEEELAYTDLGDRRLNRRLVKSVTNLAQRPSASVPEASRGWADTKGTYRLWDSKAAGATPANFLAGHQERTVERIEALQEGTILAVQYTSDIVVKGVEGGGYLDWPNQQGLKMHSVLAVSESGVPLGLLEQRVWGRKNAEKGKAKPQKESQRWVDGFTASQAALPSSIKQVVMVADREADMYELFSQPRHANAQLLIRAAQDRRVRTAWDDVSRLKESMELCRVGGMETVQVSRGPNRAPREALLTLRWMSLTLLPPHTKSTGLKMEGEPVMVLWAVEEHPPQGQKPIDWLLLTTLEINDSDDAMRYVRWYSYRWLIERFHFTLKSGCRVEALQLETADRFMRALATYSVVAWRLLWITYEARREPDQRCDRVLTLLEWQVLWRYFQKGLALPRRPPSLQQAVRWIAQLGGFLARKADGEPGVMTLWRGMRHLADMVEGTQLDVDPAALQP
jgi:hypothetical protein